MQDVTSNPTRAILTGATALFCARVAMQAVAVVRIAVIARFLGVSDFGRYAFALSVILLFFILAELGLPSVLIREGARDKTRIPVLLRSALMIRAPILFFIVVACALVFSLAGSDRDMIYGVALLGIGFGLSSLAGLFLSGLRALQKMGVIAVFQTARELGTLALISAALVYGYGIAGLCAALAFAGMLTLLASMILYRRYVGPLPLSRREGRVAYLAREGLPAAVTVMVHDLLINLSIAILMMVRGKDDVAFLSAALRFVNLFRFVPASYQEAVYPVLSGLFEASKNAWRKTLTRSLEILIALGLLLAVLIGLLCGEAIELIYGGSFEPAANALFILSPSILFLFVSSLTYPFFVSANRQRLGMLLSGGGLAITALAVILLSLKGGYKGCAAGITIGEGLLCAVALVVLWRMKACPDLGLFLIKALTAGAVLSGIAWGFDGIHLLPRAALGTAVYVAVLFLLKGFTVIEVRRLIEISFKKSHSDESTRR
ncbi:oligosaccharide flippase family protein [Acidobacteriota bacterium]